MENTGKTGLNPEKKLGGVLAPVFAIRGNNDLGVGDTEALKELASWAARHGLGVVQILPVNETGSDHSPYNILSSMALEPSTITTTPAVLPDLTEADFTKITTMHDLTSLKTGEVQYAKVKALKRDLLKAAYKNFRARGGDKTRTKAFALFEKKHADWLANYAFYRALVTWNEDSEVVATWPEAQRNPASAAEWLTTLPTADKRTVNDLKRYHAYVQWVAYEQWKGVRAHCEQIGVSLMGDVPVGVSIYSADVWAEPEIFDLERSSGAPPEKVFKSDPFTEQWGQNWGFPLYKWEQMAHDDFAWWRRRLRGMMEIFDLIRVDHALGFFRIYSFPWRPEKNSQFTDLNPDQAKAITGGTLPGFVEYDDSTQENQEYNRRQGEMIFKVMLEETGPHRLIAEDLGEVSPYVRPVLASLEIPGFKIPQWERTWDGGPLTPGAEYQRLSLATFATHDHPPIKKFWDDWYATSQSTSGPARDAVIHAMWEILDFCGVDDNSLPKPFTPEIHQMLVRGLFLTNSWLAVHMITDILGTDERFNVPGAVGDTNWTTRMTEPVSEWDIAWKSQINTLKKALIESERIISS